MRSYSFAFVTILLTSLTFIQCKSKVESSDELTTSLETKTLKISLAQWSIHRSIESGAMLAEDFASIAKNDFGIDAIEYVATFYKPHATDKAFWEVMKKRADSLSVKNLLIMVDNEGDLGSQNETERKQAVENHFKWVEAASILGCHSIRINAFGEGEKEDVKMAMIESLKQLGAYASDYNINVLIENHGLYSSDGQWVADIMKRVGMPNVGTLPDFGNWCTGVKWGTTENNACEEPYDRYQGTAELLPFARGVSAKSYSFNDEGEETTIDYGKMLKLVYQSDFDGYVGIEFEGSGLPEPDGIMKTKSLIEMKWQEIARTIK